MRIIKAILFCLLANSLWAWPPPQFANGTFASGTMAVGASTGPPASSSPSDGYEANLYAYFKCDETDGNPIDLVGAANLVNDSGGTAANQAGIIGQGFDMSGPLDDGWLAEQSSADHHYDVSSHDFTIRLWVYVREESSGSAIRRDDWEIDVDNNGVTATAIWQVTVAFSPFQSQITSPAFSLNAWHRVTVWHKVGVEFGLQIDNDSPTINSIANNLLTGASAKLTFDFSYAGIDEIAIWKDYVLTSDDRTFDWNSGAGRTYQLP